MADRGYVPPVVGTASNVVAAAQTAHTVSNAIGGGSNNEEDPFVWETPEQEYKRHRERRRKKRRATIFVVTIALLGVFVGVAAMVIEASSICYLTFVLPVLVAPYAIYQRIRLNKVPTFRDMINKARAAVNRLHNQVNRLRGEVSKLEAQRKELDGVEGRLEVISNHNGRSLQELKGLINENGKILREMKKLNEAKELQSFLSAILASDRDGDSHLSVSELESLMIRLKAFSNRPIDEERLREAFRMSSAYSTTSLFSKTSAAYKERQLDQHSYLGISMEPSDWTPAGCASGCREATTWV